MFINEYVNQIANPENQQGWEALNKKDKKEAIILKNKFLSYINYLNKEGGIDEALNVKRGRAFFNKWLAEYGDDSIAEMGGVHLCCEGLSNIAINEIQAKRIGLSPLEKSSRYVSFSSKRLDGNFQYIVPGEIKGTNFEKSYRKEMDRLFEVYSDLQEKYLEYIKDRYPMAGDETDKSFAGSRSAKRYDDLRDLLPFSTQSNIALFGNGRAFEDIVNRLLAHPLGEIRWWGKAIAGELEKVVPSFVARPKTVRGAEIQLYRRNINVLRYELADQILKKEKKHNVPKTWVRLLNVTPNSDVEVLASFLFAGARNISFDSIKKAVKKLSVKKRQALLEQILAERKFGKNSPERPEVRFRKVPRAFENAHFTFAVWARGGDYRDLHRHRQQTQERQLFTTAWGFDLEPDLLKSPFAEDVKRTLVGASILYTKIAKDLSPLIAQYTVPYAFIQHWYMHLTAREIYWMGELRTGPQGRTHYRTICRNIAEFAAAYDRGTKALFSGIIIDKNDYSLARRESEKKIESKLKKLEEK
jgi:thymidylate synthase ThyX